MEGSQRPDWLREVEPSDQFGRVEVEIKVYVANWSDSAQNVPAAFTAVRNSTIYGFSPEGSHTVPHVNDFVRKIALANNWVYYTRYEEISNQFYQGTSTLPSTGVGASVISIIGGHYLILPHLLLYAPLTARGVRFRTDDPFLLSVLDDITFAVGRVTISGIKIKRYVLGQFRGAKDFQPNVREIYLRPPLYIDMNTILGFVIPNVPSGIHDALLDVYLLDAYYGPIQ